ncbi:DUF7310 family coiled-coil domain-containing protein [Halorussus lipolyticus]|uniref:DUF7310 family coiled-coil domain-containing protein n=1 Tax=Halorussus lipolyticus TaxID=3034024 RepID=UPI0023E8D8C2|nr:hypothetical protein [Halorussus sp. DT80]
MSDFDALDERLRAVERALTDHDSDLTDLRDAAELTREVERLADRLDDAEERLDGLDAGTQALRGYVGNVRAVNESVERRADTALAKAEEVEAELDGIDASASANADAEPRPVAPSHPTRPCGCERDPRRIASCPARSESDAERKDAGLLARIAAVLR